MIIKTLETFDYTAVLHGDMSLHFTLSVSKVELKFRFLKTEKKKTSFFFSGNMAGQDRISVKCFRKLSVSNGRVETKISFMSK